MTDSTTHIVFLLLPGITQLDFTAPAQALCRMPGAVLAGAAARLDPIATDSGFAILPTHDFASAPQADILCIPGGHGVTDALNDTIGRTSCRERVGQYVEISVVAVSLKTKTNRQMMNTKSPNKPS